MDLAETMLDWARPITLFEVVPPAAEPPENADRLLEKVKRFRDVADGMSVPEIVPEGRGESNRVPFRPRVESRVLASRIRTEWGLDAVVNRVVVLDADPRPWFEETREKFGIRNLILVGGDSSQMNYPGPGVGEAASLVEEAGLDLVLGGISIPSREQEADRIRAKRRRGIRFFTTQVLLDSNDITGLIRDLNGVEARIFLTFAPISDPRDLEFLRRLGVDIPADTEDFLLEEKEGRRVARPDCVSRSIELAARVIGHVFENLPPSPPSVGLMVGHINRRNFETAYEMLKRLRGIYERYVYAQARARLPRHRP